MKHYSTVAMPLASCATNGGDIPEPEPTGILIDDWQYLPDMGEFVKGTMMSVDANQSYTFNASFANVKVDETDWNETLISFSFVKNLDTDPVLWFPAKHDSIKVWIDTEVVDEYVEGNDSEQYWFFDGSRIWVQSKVSMIEKDVTFQFELDSNGSEIVPIVMLKTS